MTTSNAHLYAAPAQITLDGRIYRLSPLTIADYAEFERWMQAQYMQDVMENLRHLPPGKNAAEDRQAVLRDAYAKVTDLKIGSPKAAAYIMSLEGMAQLLWMMFRHRHPEVELEQVRHWMHDPSRLREFEELSSRLNGGDQPANPPMATAAEKSTRPGRPPLSPSDSDGPSNKSAT